MKHHITTNQEKHQLSEETPTNTPTKSTNISTDASAEALKSEPSEDLIKRSDAIEAIELVDWYHQNSNKDMVHGANSDEHQAWYKADDVYKALEAVPSSDRPKGEWIVRIIGGSRSDMIGDCIVACDQCGEEKLLRSGREKWNFCSNCGADMRGGKDD